MPLESIKLRETSEPASQALTHDLASPALPQKPVDKFDLKLKAPISFSGRVATTTAAGSMAAMFNSSVGSGIRYGVTQGLQEMGLESLARIVEDGGGKIDLPLGASLALRFNQKVYKAGDRQICKDEIRKVCDALYLKEGKDIVWVEAGGIAELGGGGEGTMALGALAEGQAELALKGLVRYRRLEPYETPSGVVDNSTIFSNAVNVPTSAAVARQIPPGGEFEITGTLQGEFNPGMKGSGPLTSGPVGVSIEGSSGLKSDLKADASILVQRLPAADHVMVKISVDQAASASLGLSLDAKVGLDPRMIKAMPKVGQGVLKFLLERLGLPNLTQLADSYFNTSIAAGASVQKSNREIGRYVFDLSKPEAQAAYEAVFSKFSTAVARELAQKKDSGVQSQYGTESGSTYSLDAHIELAQSKVLLYQALQSEREGRMKTKEGNDIVFRESKFAKKYTGVFSGAKAINWESVVVHDQAKKQQQKFYHLNYSNQDRVTQESEVRDFMNFSSALGLRASPSSSSTSPKASDLARVFNNRDDTLTNVDLYFTDEGISRIDRASAAQCVAAHLSVQSEFDPACKQLPFLKDPKSPGLAMADRYNEIQNKWFFTRWWFWGERAKIEKSYEKTYGRPLAADAKALKSARAFATELETLDEKTDPKNVERFFSYLGKSKGFDYMKTICALAQLAGQNETLIHELSISGGGLTLCSADEGQILHPEQELTLTMAKLA